MQGVVPKYLPERHKREWRPRKIVPREDKAAENRYVAGNNGTQRSEQNPFSKTGYENRNERTGCNDNGEYCDTESPDG
jgi:hypothetical protein